VFVLDDLKGLITRSIALLLTKRPSPSP